MTDRFLHAIDAAAAPLDVTLASLAKNFADAVVHAEAEGGEAVNDPAVLLLGSFIAFHTHADVNTASGFRRLLQLCHDRLADPPILQ